MITFQGVDGGDQAFHVFCRRNGKIAEIADDKKREQNSAVVVAYDNQQQEDVQCSRNQICQTDPAQVPVERGKLDADLHGRERDQSKNRPINAVAEAVLECLVKQKDERNDGDNRVEKALPSGKRHTATSCFLLPGAQGRYIYSA